MKKLLLVLLLASSILTHAQNIRFQKYGVSEGLSSNMVFSTIEDKDGFIWISTEEGVDRFDGLNFKHYSLPNLYEYRTANRVYYHLKIDSNNQIWLFTRGGLLYQYDSKKDEFVLFYMLKNETDQAVYTFFIDHNNDLWFGMEDGVLLMNPVTKQFKRISALKGLTASIIQDNKQRYYFGNDNGIVVLDSNKEFLYNLLDVSSSKNIGLKGSLIKSLFIDEKNERLWVGSNKLGLCAFNLINFDFIKPEDFYENKGLIIRNIEQFSPEEVILGIDGEGLIIWDLNKQQVNQKIIPQDDRPDALSSRSVQQVFRNSTGVFFISTFRGGLNVFSPGKLNFKSIKHSPNNSNSLRNNVVMELHKLPKNNIVFSTDKGISVWDVQKKNWQQLYIKHKGIKNISNSRSITVDDKSNIWATTYTDSLVVFKKNKKGDYVSTKDFNSDLSTYQFNIVYAGKNDLIWFSDDNKKLVSSYSTDTQNLTHYPNEFGNVQAMLDLSPERFALGTSSGLVIINTNTGDYEYEEIINSTLLETAMISTLAVDSNKQLWVGTRYEGLFVVNFFKNTITKLTVRDGLLSNRIFALSNDKENVWVSTSKGISRIDNKNNISNFTKSEGLISVDFNYDAAFNDVNGKLYFGTNDGVISFDPDEIHVVESNKSLVFNEFYLNHKLVLPGDNSPLSESIINTELIQLEHDQNSFSISFTSIDFLNPDHGSFQWKLENFDKEWVSSQGGSIASYTNLNPGNYVFRVRMIDEKEELIAVEKQVELIIHKPFWMTIWAFIIYLSIVLLLIALIIYSNSLRIESKNSKERLHFLINMAHEIKTPLMLIKAPLTDLLKNNNTVDVAMQQGINIALKNAEKVHRQMIQFLDFRRLNVQKTSLNLDPIDLVQLLKDKVFAFKVLADKKKIDFSLDTNLAELIINTDQKAMDKVLSNLMSNAIKYTKPKGRVDVKLVVMKKKCKILIKDSGIGIPTSQKKKVFRLFYRTPAAKESDITGSGVGLALASDLAKLIGGKVTLEESSPKGSVFSFIFPYECSILVDEETTGISNDLESLDDESHIISKPKVLLVEDNEDLRNYSKDKLKGKFNVNTASNGYVAMEILKKELPDIVVSDIMMPKVNGRQLCMSLKKNIETCHLPVILLTGLGSKEHIIEGLESGADDYLVKPYDYELLISKIDGLLNNRLVLKKKFLVQDEKEEVIKFSNELDTVFMKELTQFVEDNIGDANVSAKDLCEAMGMSRTSFYHKLKSLIDVSPNEFIRTIRLKKGRSMLLKYNYNVSEVAYSVGFSDAKYFGTLFKKYFGQSPSAFVAEKKQDI